MSTAKDIEHADSTVRNFLGLDGREKEDPSIEYLRPDVRIRKLIDGTSYIAEILVTAEEQGWLVNFFLPVRKPYWAGVSISGNLVKPGDGLHYCVASSKSHALNNLAQRGI